LILLENKFHEDIEKFILVPPHKDFRFTVLDVIRQIDQIFKKYTSCCDHNFLEDITITKGVVKAYWGS
jgi:hypothetical protein